MRRRGNTRYPHAFSKGQGVGFTAQGTWRPQAPCILQTEAPGMTTDTDRARPSARMQRSDSANSALKQRSDSANKISRSKYLKVSPTIADLYRSHAGIAVICADCLHGVGHRNPGLPDRYRRQWGLTLLELEKKCRCEMCGSKNARVYPWWGEAGGVVMGLKAAVGEGRPEMIKPSLAG